MGMRSISAMIEWRSGLDGPNGLILFLNLMNKAAVLRKYSLLSQLPTSTDSIIERMFDRCAAILMFPLLTNLTVQSLSNKLSFCKYSRLVLV